MSMKLVTGPNWMLENKADELLAKHRAQCTTLDEKTDILSEAQMNLRTQREVYNHLGYADGQLVNGMYHRIFNPDMGQRPSRLGSSED